MKTCFTSDERKTVTYALKFAHFAEIDMGVPAIYARIHGDNQQAFTISYITHSAHILNISILTNQCK
jgi:hypothetical protein